MLLVGALLLCHGVLGYAHQNECHGVCEAAESVPRSSPAHDAQEGLGHGPAGQLEDGSGGAPESGQAPGGYFAVVLAMFGAAFLVLLRARRWRETAARILYRPRSLPAFACLPRGPSLPLLQVFRL